jgi:SpoVK/Ycf46/Vps4 family AAA+-type ATPase
MRKMKKLPFSNLPDVEVQPFLRLWIYRILTKLGGLKEFVNSNGFDDEAIAELIGLKNPIDNDSYDSDELLQDIDSNIEFNPAAARRKIIINGKIAEENAPSILIPKSLLDKTHNIAKMVGLNEVDTNLLGFAILLDTEEILETATELIGTLSTTKVYRALSTILNIPTADIKDALSSKGALFQSGLLRIDQGAYHLPTKLDMLSKKFSDAVLVGESDPEQLFRDTLKKSTPAILKIGNYKQISKELEILRPLLSEAVKKRIPGINIYIHGPAGTGKTELVKVLAEDLSTELYQIAYEDEDGDPIKGEKRLRSYSAAQSFLKKRKAILLFDEVEDIFNDDSFMIQSTAQKRKAWMNRALEENVIPTLWLSNTCDGLDPAFIRRYSMVFEIPIPAQSQRMQILEQYTQNTISTHILKQLSKSEDLSPAVIANAAKVMGIISNISENVSANEGFPKLVNQTLEAQNYAPVRINQKECIQQPYDTSFINANINIDILISGLAKNRFGRICFYGPPGTGKTALGKHIAQRLDIPLICKKVSDLQSKWVGEAEKNIAKAFKRASDENALLLIDEVDSFLRERSNATHSWEQTQVNEMLTQIENFEGIFIASTNLIDQLDAASIRRFDAKVKFDYMSPNQITAMINDFCVKNNISIQENGVSNLQKNLHAITPGDFALISRQIKFNPIKDYFDLIGRLEQEQILKGERNVRIGFI